MSYFSRKLKNSLNSALFATVGIGTLRVDICYNDLLWINRIFQDQIYLQETRVMAIEKCIFGILTIHLLHVQILNFQTF